MNVGGRALRQIPLDRNHSQSIGSVHGGSIAAVVCGPIATCERYRVDPFEYLRDVFKRIAPFAASGLADLLPARRQPRA